MRYRNIKTGLYLITDCKISSPDFELIGKETAKPTPKKNDSPKGRSKGKK